MNEEERRLPGEGAFAQTMQALREAEEALPDYTDSYDGEIRRLYEKIVNRPAFSYDAGSDPLYASARERYVREGRAAMRDTLGQAAHLTGGYHSSYGQAAAQQQYGAYLQKLGELMPELYGQALRRWQSEGESLKTQFDAAQKLSDRAYTRRAERQKTALALEQQLYDRRWAAYQSMMKLISASGYAPTDEELQSSGMSREQAEALRKEFLRVNGLSDEPVTDGGIDLDALYYGPGDGSTTAKSKEQIKLESEKDAGKGRRRMK